MLLKTIDSQKVCIPPITPVIEISNRPFWSVMITAYLRTEYLEQSLRSVLVQALDIEQMQIEVVDDCSPNHTEIEELVNDIGKGRVSFYSTPQNMGIFSNWNTCIQRAKGRWVHILSDDDVLLPNFYQAYEAQIRQHDCSVVISQSIVINEYGQWTGITDPLAKDSRLLENALFILAKTNPIRTPSIVVARDMYEKIGGFTTDLIYAPDWEMWTRLATFGSVSYVNRPYNLYRYHDNSETNRLILTGQSITDSLLALEIIQTRITNLKDRINVRQSAHRWLSKESFILSRKLVNKRQYRAAIIHSFWALRLFPCTSNLKNLVFTLLKVPLYLIKTMIFQY